MQVICERRWGWFSSCRRRRRSVIAGQVNDDLPHGRNAIIFRNEPFFRLLRCCFRRLIIVESFLLSNNGGSVSFNLLDKRIPFQCFRIDQFSVHDTVPGQFLPDSDRINIIQDIFRFFRFRVLCRRRVSHPRIRNRQTGISIGTLHFRKLRLFRFSKISSGFDHAPDMLLYSWPAQPQFLRKAALRQPHTLTAVIHKATGAIQIGVAVSASAIFLFEKFLRDFRVRTVLIKGSDP